MAGVGTCEVGDTTPIEFSFLKFCILTCLKIKDLSPYLGKWKVTNGDRVKLLGVMMMMMMMMMMLTDE
jgi:hypothetical protein